MIRPLTLLAAFVLVLAACGGGTDTSAPSDAATTATSTTTTAAPPTTTAPTTTTAASTTTVAADGITPGADADVDAVVLAYQVAFDSASTYENKAPYIDDPTGLEETVAAYLAAGEAVGGIEVATSAVTVSGDAADVTYDLLFGGNPTYPGLSGTAVKTPEGWKVPRAVFCSLMSSARVGCP